MRKETRHLLEVLSELDEEVLEVVYGIDAVNPDDAPLDVALVSWRDAGCPDVGSPRRDPSAPLEDGERWFLLVVDPDSMPERRSRGGRRRLPLQLAPLAIYHDLEEAQDGAVALSAINGTRVFVLEASSVVGRSDSSSILHRPRSPGKRGRSPGELRRMIVEDFPEAAEFWTGIRTEIDRHENFTGAAGWTRIPTDLVPIGIRTEIDRHEKFTDTAGWEWRRAMTFPDGPSISAVWQYEFKVP